MTAGMYAVYMAGIYSAMSVVGHLGAIQVVIAVVAGIFGVIRPETMNDPVEATLVFVAAFAFAGLVHLVVRRRTYRLGTP